jgi:hypothetical protein
MTATLNKAKPLTTGANMRYPPSPTKPETLALVITLVSASPLLLPSLVHAQQSASAEVVVEHSNKNASSQTITTDIAAGSLSGALNQLAQLTGVALSYEPSLTAGKTTQGVCNGLMKLERFIA